MNYLDLFSGIGGFHLGLEQAGFKFDWVGFSEIDKYATQTYKRRSPDAEELGSIVNIRPETLPELDSVTFGFPCQDLSVAGQRKGLSGERSGLFFTAMRIIEVTKPKIFIFENVKGLFSSNEGKDFKTVLRTIADIGLYECEWGLINTRWFLPQNRERVYFIGHLRGASRPKVFPFRESDFKFNEVHGQQPQITGTIGCGRDIAVSKIIQRPHGYNKGGIKELPSLRGSCMEHNDFLKTGTQVRRLTPTECERLQGFPDGWTDGLSDTQRYKTLGNAVSVPVVKAIGERLL